MPGKTKTAAALIAVVVLLAGCTPEPEPTPTPTGFASEAEAFAAAEETYRAYVEASNAHREDPGSADPNQFLTGNALEDQVRSDERFAEQGIRFEGPTRITSVEGLDASANTVTISVCVDVSETLVFNASGEDITPPDRTPIAPMEITLVERANGLFISESVSGRASCS